MLVMLSFILAFFEEGLANARDPRLCLRTAKPMLLMLS